MSVETPMSLTFPFDAMIHLLQAILELFYHQPHEDFDLWIMEIRGFLVGCQPERIEVTICERNKNGYLLLTPASLIYPPRALFCPSMHFCHLPFFAT